MGILKQKYSQQRNFVKLGTAIILCINRTTPIFLAELGVERENGYNLFLSASVFCLALGTSLHVFIYPVCFVLFYKYERKKKYMDKFMKLRRDLH